MLHWFSSGVLGQYRLTKATVGFQGCGGSGKVLEAQLKHCNEQPCSIQVNTDAELEMNFTHASDFGSITGILFAFKGDEMVTMVNETFPNLGQAGFLITGSIGSSL